MSHLFGNLCLLVAALLAGTLYTPLFQHKMSHGNNEGAGGYMIILVVIVHLLILSSLIFAAFAISRQGGFDWLPAQSVSRFLLIAIGLLSAMSISALCLMSRFVPQTSTDFLTSVMRITPALIMVILIGSGFILLNTSLRQSLPAALYKWPLMLMSVGCLLGVLGFTASIVFAKSYGVQGSTRNYENAPSVISDRLQQIETYDASSDIVTLLELTGNLYPAEVQQKASARIKTNPNWEADLLHLLQTDQALAVFNFLARNDVTDKSRFAGPIKTGIQFAAGWIRATIQGTSSREFYPDMFNDETERILLTVKRFEGPGVDYLPDIKAMRSALDEPIYDKKVKFECIAQLDHWIQAHQ